MNSVMEIANSPIMWGFASLVIAMAVIQSTAMVRLAGKFAKKTDLLSREEIKACIKTGGIVAIGPAVAVFIVAIGMISQLGAPITLMRIGVIGSAPTELMAAGIGAGAAGAPLGSPEFNIKAFTAAVWTMAFMSSGYLIFVPFLTRGIGKISSKVNQKKRTGFAAKLPLLVGTVLPVLVIGAFSVGQLMEGRGHAVALLTAVVTMGAMNVISKVRNIQWLREWATGFAVIFAMVAGTIAG